MDFAFLYLGQRFVWDETKAKANLAKHGVSFEEACEVFFDPFVRAEDASVPEEARDAVIGMTEEWTVAVVVHLRRDGDVIRIISARTATTQERRAYEDGE